MFNFISILVILAIGFSIVSSYGETMLGPGKWSVLNINKCEEDSTMLYKFDISRHKISRTQDGFDIRMNFVDVIDSTFAIRIDICKVVDGGCKPYQTMADDSFERFVKKYAENNVKRALTMGNIDPPDFPIPIGTLEIDSFVMDYDELPPDGLYGEFGAKAYILKDGLDKGCLQARVQFTKEQKD